MTRRVRSARVTRRRSPDVPPRSAAIRPADRNQVDSGLDAWVGLVAHGDTAAFERMVDEFAAPLRRFAFRYTRSRDVASEVVQDVFYKLWRNRTNGAVFAGRQQLQAYLYRAARNNALDYIAREATRSRWQRATRERPSDDMIPLHAAPADTHAELAELAATIDQVLAEMPDRRREVCVLRWRHGHSVGEVAKRLGISTKTVEAQVGRGLRQLRERIARQQ
jgi:RNA polymerase sigma-19 factor, ECF subfamily